MDATRKYTVYRLTNQVTGQCYVGVTCTTLHARWLKHLSCARTGANSLLYRAMREHGAEAFAMTPVRVGVIHTDRWTAEREEIARAGSYGGGYNELPGVPQSLDDPGVPECFGPNRPPMSAARRERMRSLFTNRMDSAATRERKSAAQKGNRKCCKPVVYDGVEYPSIGECAIALGLKRGVIEWGIRRHGRGHFQKKVA